MIKLMEKTQPTLNYSLYLMFTSSHTVRPLMQRMMFKYNKQSDEAATAAATATAITRHAREMGLCWVYPSGLHCSVPAAVFCQNGCVHEKLRKLSKHAILTQLKTKRGMDTHKAPQ